MKKSVRKQIVLSVVIAAIMVLSAFAIIFGGFAEPSDRIRYNGTAFTLSADGYGTKANGRMVYFAHSPFDADDVPLDALAASAIRSSKMVYISYEQNSAAKEGMALAQFELSRVLTDYFGIYAAAAMASDNQYGLPVISCSNASAFVPVISMAAGNETRASFSNNCLLLQASAGSEFSLLKDRLLYSLFGII